MTSTDPPRTPAPHDCASHPGQEALPPDQMTALERTLTALKCRECGEGMDPEIEWYHEPCSGQQEAGIEIRTLRAQVEQTAKALGLLKTENESMRAVVEAAREADAIACRWPMAEKPYVEAIVAELVIRPIRAALDQSRAPGENFRNG